MVIRLSQCRRWCFCVGLGCNDLSPCFYITVVQLGARVVLKGKAEKKILDI